jgi:hypothetical protein
MKMAAFWEKAPFSLVEADRRFNGKYCRQHQGDLMIEAVCTTEVSVYLNEITRRYIPEGCHVLDSFHLSSSNRSFKACSQHT